MAIAFDNSSSGAPGGLTSATVSHTPTGTPRGVLVFVASNTASTGATYGGTAMTEVTGSPVSEGSFRHASVYLLGSSVPSGTQNAVVSYGAAAEGNVTVVSLTATADVEFQNSATDSGASANPSFSLSLSGESCFVGQSFISGRNAVTDVTELAGWTNRNENDIGSQLAACYTYDTIGTADVTCGWTQLSDNYAAISVAVKEAAASGPVVPVFANHYNRLRNR